MLHNQGFLDLVNAARTHVPELTVDQVCERMTHHPSVYVVDVREDTEWTNGHVAGAQHIGKGVIERDIEQKIPDKSAEIILYCGGGYRSILAAEAIQKLGYTNVASMSGGWRAWNDAGAPTE